MEQIKFGLQESIYYCGFYQHIEDLVLSP